jgi:hypothetical protein
MLSGLRFIMGAILASATLMVSALGLLSIVKLGQITTAGPTQVSRNLSFDDRTDWNQFYDADSGWRFEQLARKRIDVEPEQTSAVAPIHPPQPAAEPSAQPAVKDPLDEHAEPSGRKSPLASTPESTAPVHVESGLSAAPPASTPSTSTSLPALVAPAELATATVAATPPATPVAVVATTVVAPSSAEPPQPEPPAARLTTGIPVGDEEPPLPAQPDAASVEERHTIVPATAGSANARHVEPPRVLPASPLAATPHIERATPMRPRRTAQKSRRPGEEGPAKPHAVQRRHVQASRSAPRESYPSALPSWQPY